MPVEFQGQALSIAEWADKLGLTRQALHQRLQRHPVGDAIAGAERRKLIERNSKSYWIVIDGNEYTSRQVADMFEVSMRQVRRWAKAGLLEQRAPRGLKKCSACHEEGHYKSSRECLKNTNFIHAKPDLPSQPEGTVQRGRYAPPSDLDLQALGVVLPAESDQ